jgi:hypothetical protein
MSFLGAEMLYELLTNFLSYEHAAVIAGFAMYDFYGELHITPLGEAYLAAQITEG